MTGKSLLVAVCILLTAALAQGQETTTGSIAGRVVDAQGLAVPGATVTIARRRDRKSSQPIRTGGFFAPFLTPGAYEVKVELRGSVRSIGQNVKVRLGQRVDLPLTLQVGRVTEAVR